MKILCDVCDASEATLFCWADEAALCHACDVRIHRANKLASQHTRLSLLSSSTQPHTLCDICQERRGFVFCKEDRAIFCHECDSPIHAANDLTMKHSRFVFTGIRLSSVSEMASSPSLEKVMSKKKVSEALLRKPMAECSSSSNISEYLIKMLPGYRVEDFLLDDSVNGDVLHQSDALAPLGEMDLEGVNIGDSSAADWNFSVPNASLNPTHPLTSLTSAVNSSVQVIEESSSRETNIKQHLLMSSGGEAGSSEEVFAVPQLPCVQKSSKRPCRPWALDF